jgi:hypothetical protein
MKTAVQTGFKSRSSLVDNMISPTSGRASIHRLCKQQINFCYALLESADSQDDTAPLSYQQALKSPEAAQWRKAVKEELASLLEKGCWIYIPYPKEWVKALRAHLVLKKKTHNGEVVRFKARLVFNGSQQDWYSIRISG